VHAALNRAQLEQAGAALSHWPELISFVPWFVEAGGSVDYFLPTSFASLASNRYSRPLCRSGFVSSVASESGQWHFDVVQVVVDNREHQCKGDVDGIIREPLAGPQGIVIPSLMSLL
jgi:hypothetical protein